MGNCCIVKPIDSNVGVYLHWNGGRSSVTAFLEYCKLKDYRYFGGERADGYGIARFCQVVGNWFGGGLNLGITTNVEATEEYAKGIDNGIFIVDGWDIVDHVGNEYHDNYNLTEFLLSIDEAQPSEEQLGKEYILGEWVEATELQIGDMVGVFNLEGKCEKFEVKGYTTENDTHYDVGNPYIEKYKNNDSWGMMNPNNILRGKVRKLGKIKEGDIDAEKEPENN